MLIIETTAEDADFGKMVCYWDENPTVLFVRRIISGMVDVINNHPQRTDGPDKSEIERQLDAMTPKIYQLFEELAPEIFYQAQYRLACDIATKLAGDALHGITLVFSDGSKGTLASLNMAEALMPMRNVRKFIAEFFKTMHNELIGVKHGPRAQVTVEEIIECLRKLPKNVGLVMLASEMNLPTRTIQHTLKVGGLTFTKAKK